MRIRRIHVYLTLVLLAFGFIISYSVQFTKSISTSNPSITDSQWEKKQQLQEKILEEQIQVQKLEEQLQKIKQRVSEFEKKMGEQEDQAREVLEELDELRMWAGLLPVTGKGLMVTLNDSKTLPESGNMNDYIVHEEQIRQVVNELFSSGAEAISINGQRLTTISAIRCVGPTVLVNEVKTVPPFEISVIGESEILLSALEMPGGVIQSLKEFSNIEVKLEKKDKVDLPAYTGDSQKMFRPDNLSMKEDS
ncbi:DUF881 domain-containing protein [Ammoniphilus sp. CFH 90114]|uniref:DUF881 domain-containing protein n=1 Tax=Ammoniphilus sp. CFH 90114 TaxID=2493665 RepID=UPI00100DEB6A|nr:DUF881 domain-containing protein [Ammoniphilus sp. CFH 90114]RXT15010.1 DUF881 domain-containing protein [Ammoniphilus sp. CFH 90114]